ncbi:MAG: prepilin-type N-terminal cleavage/methylation domain-containing protein [Candidatus Margulisbacteria bacterium]|nr:prepilin-type N-terminal cleavage/methylation domain-containing protein [Candidatus Margulisiibacteriota bacterium]
MPKSNKKGFTLIEVTFVLAIIAIITAFIIPYFQGIKDESKITRAEAEVAILKNAIENYYLQTNQFPSNITTDLTGNTPKIINKILTDPFKTNSDIVPPTYGYLKNDSAKYYIVYSQGLDIISQNWVLIPNAGTYIIDKNPGCQNIIESNLEIRE